MTLCTLNENSKTAISQLFSQQSSTRDLDVGEKISSFFQLSSYLPFEVIHKHFVHFHLKSTCEKLFPNPRGGARPFPLVEFTSALHLGSWMLPSAEGLNDTHTRAELKKPKVTDMPLGFLLQGLVMVLHVVLGTHFHYLPAIWLQKFLFLCSSQELFQSH